MEKLNCYEQIAKEGHEIACHGLHHACKIHPKPKEPLMTKIEFEQRTRQAKQMLEDASEQEVIGYRAPNAYVTGWMLDSLEELGFKYDSSVSVNAFYNKTDCSLKNVDTKPYYPSPGSLETGNKRGILEIPWPYFKLGLNFPTGGGPILRFFGARYIMLGLKQSLKRGDSVFYFHPIDISRERFPLSSSIKQRLFWAIEGKTVEQRIRNILKSVEGQSTYCRDILKLQH